MLAFETSLKSDSSSIYNNSVERLECFGYIEIHMIIAIKDKYVFCFTHSTLSKLQKLDRLT